GVLALVVAAAGLAHVAAGSPGFVNSREAMANGGGAIGYVVSSPLIAATTVYVTVPLLVLLGLFSFLVLTATPVREIPARLAAVYQRLVGGAPGRDDDAAADDDLVATGRTTATLKPMGRKRGARRKAADAEA